MLLCLSPILGGCVAVESDEAFDAEEEAHDEYEEDGLEAKLFRCVVAVDVHQLLGDKKVDGIGDCEYDG